MMPVIDPAERWKLAMARLRQGCPWAAGADSPEQLVDRVLERLRVLDAAVLGAQQALAAAAPLPPEEPVPAVAPVFAPPAGPDVVPVVFPNRPSARRGVEPRK